MLTNLPFLACFILYINSQLLRTYSPSGSCGPPIHKEKTMHHFSESQLLIGAFVLILATVIAVSAFLDNRRAKASRVRDYFGPEYDRDLLLHSSLSENEDWMADRNSGVEPFCLSDPVVNARGMRVSGATWWNRERD
jgi:hypothetical protein